jgi:hypothetical protein
MDLSQNRKLLLLQAALHRRVHGATPHPYQRRRQGGSTPLIKYPLVLVLFRMPQKYALLVAYKADCGGRGCAAQYRGPFYGYFLDRTFSFFTHSSGPFNSPWAHCTEEMLPNFEFNSISSKLSDSPFPKFQVF